MSSLVGSLRLISTFDWTEFFESVSLVEQVLQRDPAGVYGRMDFRSRDRYRHAVEELAEPTGDAQLRVALKSVERARQVAERRPTSAARTSATTSSAAAGAQFEAGLGWRPPLTARARRLSSATPRPGISARLRAGTALLVALAVAVAYAHGWRGGVLVCVGAPDGRAGQRADHPDPAAGHQQPDPAAPLPRLDLDQRPCRGAHDGDRARPSSTVSSGSRNCWRTWKCRRSATSIPTSTSPSSATCATPPPKPCHRTPRSWMRRVQGIEALNAKHADGRTDRFFLFHRARQWNAQEGLWMGWERKRGKIEEFNRLLRGATDTSFVVHVGDVSVLPSVRYCITLDSDTRLPRDAARQLIGIITHPLNRPVFDPARRPRDRRIRHPAAARQRDVRQRGRLAVCAAVLRPHGRRSVHHRRVRHVPGPLQRRDLHGQGPLRRGRVHDGPP